jgi:hypothetical protein
MEIRDKITLDIRDFNIYFFNFREHQMKWLTALTGNNFGSFAKRNMNHCGSMEVGIAILSFTQNLSNI